MRTIHSVIKRTPRRYLAEIVMIDDFSNKGRFALIEDDVGCKMAGLSGDAGSEWLLSVNAHFVWSRVFSK